MLRLLPQGVRSLGAGLALCAGMTLTGCGGPTGPVLVPVSGVVTVDGAPAEGAGVSLRPDADKGNKVEWFPTGVADKEGKFTLTTTAKPGAPPGWYKIVVMPYSPPPFGGEAQKTAPPSFNAKYSKPDTTDLTINVTKSPAPGAYDLKLTK